MIIHCDFCGSAFDPEKHAVCPKCGGPWDKDQEVSRVRTEEERRAEAEKTAAESESFIKTASAISQTARDVGRAVGSVGRVFRVIFAILFLLVLCFILFVAFKIFSLI